jgi:hypothetical protein
VIGETNVSVPTSDSGSIVVNGDTFPVASATIAPSSNNGSGPDESASGDVGNNRNSTGSGSDSSDRPAVVGPILTSSAVVDKLGAAARFGSFVDARLVAVGMLIAMLW